MANHIDGPWDLTCGWDILTVWVSGIGWDTHRCMGDPYENWIIIDVTGCRVLWPYRCMGVVWLGYRCMGVDMAGPVPQMVWVSCGWDIIDVWLVIS